MQESVAESIKFNIKITAQLLLQQVFLPWVFFVDNFELQSVNLNTGETATYYKFPSTSTTTIHKANISPDYVSQP
jgi:hypothetical protein